MAIRSYTRSDVSRLMMRHQAAIYGYIFALVKKHSDAEDIFQDVSIAALKSISQLKDEAGFFPWAREIAHRRVLSHFRKLGRERSLKSALAVALANASDVIERQSPLSRRREALLECLDALPVRSQKLVKLRYGRSGQKVKNIANRFGKSVKSIYSRLDRIREILRNCIKRRLETEEPK